MTAQTGWGAPPGPPDPKRWIALVILSSTLFIIVLDNTILNVAVPTIIRQFHTQVSSLQWVISGYSLIFASLLISFGRLGDIVGRRKMFFIGAALFAIGSLIASLSQSVVQLFLGESLIEGIGAAMMLPATLSILSATFRGRERGVAFAVWGSVAGGAGALGPVDRRHPHDRLLVALGVPRQRRDRAARDPRRHLLRARVEGRACQRARPAGVVAVTVGLLALVFGIIEAARYGWWKPIGDQSIGGWTWPLHAVSVVPVSLAIAVIVLAVFVRLELRRRRATASRSCSTSPTSCIAASATGLINTTVLAMGEFGAFFVLPIFLQAGLHLSAIRSGTWLLPAGVMAFVGGGIGGQLSRRFGPKYVITIGLTLEALGIWLLRRRVLALHDVPRAAPGADAARHRHRVRHQSAHQRGAERHPAAEGGFGERRGGHGAPGRHRARHRAHRRDLRVAGDEPRAPRPRGAHATSPPRCASRS